MFEFVKRIFGDAPPAGGDTSKPRPRLDFGAADPAFPIYAIGDVHGRVDLLEAAEAQIIKDLDNGPGMIVLLGDYVDRGPNSAAVIDRLRTPPTANIRRIALCGNHETAFLGFISNPLAHMQWLDFGGRQTLLSYGIDADHLIGRGRRGVETLSGILRESVPASHIGFLESLPVYVRIGSFVFVHAGLRPGVALEAQSDEDMLWIREPFLSQGCGLPLTVVHGHTPVAEPQTGPGRIGIDTGAFTTGRLTVLKVLAGRASLLA